MACARRASCRRCTLWTRPPARVARPCLFVPSLDATQKQADSARCSPVLQPCLLSLLTLVLQLPTFALGRATFLARCSRSCRYAVVRQVWGRGRQSFPQYRGSARSWLTTTTATAGARLGRQEVEPIAVEVIGWLIQQDEVMVCAEEAGEAHSIPLTHRERRERRLGPSPPLRELQALSAHDAQRPRHQVPLPSLAQRRICLPRHSRRACGADSVQRASSAVSGAAIASATTCPTVRFSSAAISCSAIPTVPISWTVPLSGVTAPVSTWRRGICLGHSRQ
jgi:hypothetical protein